MRVVQISWKRLLPYRFEAIELFYQRLFSEHPELRESFRHDMSNQRDSLLVILDNFVANLDRIDDVVPGLQRLGRRHAAYGVRDEHYDAFNAALIWSFREVLADEFDDEMRHAWELLCGLLAMIMRDGARVHA
jgi:hemoglobin-like flavoprotein